MNEVLILIAELKPLSNRGAFNANSEGTNHKQIK
jgi:hypothetical protein